eukprot:TRINITY_DN1774_c0_g1_i1.p1 TRINITY_DN1774_c0_g1~~TRINITY_DN1774_c0_g1_i1.p1  ORF type:complete len:471 (-),score=36.63 TRINITY_DN1774_c0_g1_i1:283-1695(-)
MAEKSPCKPPTPTKSPYLHGSPSTPSRTPSEASVSPTQGSPNPLRYAADRFIPCRKRLDFEIANFALTQQSQEPANEDDAASTYNHNLATSLFEDRPMKGIFVSPTTPALTALDQHNRQLHVLYSQNKSRNFKSKSYRVIPQTPERILDAPELLDDYYLNLLDWSALNILVVVLNQTVYLWNAESGSIQQLLTTQEEGNIVTGVSWATEQEHVLGVGLNSSEVQLWDTTASKRIRSLHGHASRVGSLSWCGPLLASGSRDSTILVHDTRADSHIVARLTAHQQEVCGLKWSLDGTQLASGGNDNLLAIWDSNRWERPRLQLRSHTAAVKALGWSPHQPHLLASGGGTQDRTLRFWNTSSGVCLHQVDTKSQVCAVLWSRHANELITSHGFSENQLSLWKYPSLKKIVDLTGHTSRVLHLAMSPDGETVVSAAGDETIRFWKCFAIEEKRTRLTPSKGGSPLSPDSALLLR